MCKLRSMRHGRAGEGGPRTTAVGRFLQGLALEAAVRALGFRGGSDPDVEHSGLDGRAILLADEQQVAAHGEAAWNGVAILSRVGLEDVVAGLDGAPGFPHPEARAIAATCDGVRVVSVYVPTTPNPTFDFPAGVPAF